MLKSAKYETQAHGRKFLMFGVTFVLATEPTSWRWMGASSPNINPMDMADIPNCKEIYCSTNPGNKGDQTDIGDKILSAG